MRWRISVILTLVVAVTVVLTGRLYAMAITGHAGYVSRAQEQQNVILSIQPKRGDIYLQDLAAQHVTVAAKSVELFALSATPKYVTKKREYAAALAAVSGRSADELYEIFTKDRLYMDPIAHGLTKEQVDALAVTLNAIERQAKPTHKEVKVNYDQKQGDIIYFIGGTFFVREYKRTYPEGALLGQSLGFVNDKGEGQYGFEGQYDTQLRGYSGQIRLEKDSRGNLLSQGDSIAWQDGTSYELTIDRNIQYVAEQELAKQIKDSEALSGSVIIMDPKTGDIIALANQPGYDPNSFAEVAKSNQVALFDNLAISGSWEPGSIMKPLVMAAALDTGTVTPQTKGTFAGSVTVEGYTIETALRKAYGEETMTQVLENSDNVAMVWLAEQLGNERMHNYLKAFGFGEKTNVDLKGEISGNLLALKRWRDINRATMAFGQGIATTPIQVTSAYCAVANGGVTVHPHIVKATVAADGTRREQAVESGVAVIKPETAAQLKDMMVSTVVRAHARAGVNGYKVAGKTGTAQVPDPENGGYLEDTYNHSFVGFAPSDDPKYVMLVKIDRPNLAKAGTYAEYTAVPLFSRLSQFLLNYYQVPPTNR